MSLPMSIGLGSHRVNRMRYEDIQPGDLVCTYEALTTRPDLLSINFFQTWATFSHRPELNKLFHFEIVTEKYPRSGACRIAHADGGTQKVGMQDDCFKEHHPGQAFVVFRAKDPHIQRQIASVAQKTAEEGNGHTCKILKMDTLRDRLGHIFRFFKFENFGHLTIDRKLKNIAQMTAQYEQSGRFYHADGSGSKEMSCVEYAANVANVAAAQILCPKHPIEDRVSAVFARLKELYRDPSFSGLPLKFSHGDSTPASMVDFLLRNRSHFELAGYMGYIADPIEGPLLDLEGTPISTSLEKIKRSIQANPLQVAKAMKALGILSDTGYIYPKKAIDPVKIQTLEQFLHTDCSALLQPLNLKDSSFFSEFGSLSIEEESTLLGIEKEVLKKAPIERTAKTLKISLNALSLKQIGTKKIEQIAERVFEISQKALKTVVLAPASYLFSWAGRIVRLIAATKRLEIETIRTQILVAHEKVNKKGRVHLTSHIPEETRPWVHYSIDGGRTWEQEPFQGIGSTWNASIHIPDEGDLIYKLFLGPVDVNDYDPIAKAVSWQNDNPQREICVSKEQMQKKEEGYGPCWVIEHRFPVWGKGEGLPMRSPQIFQYQNQCERLAPSENAPLEIQDYEQAYANLETTLPLVMDLEGKIEDQLILFLDRELKIQVSPNQLQSMQGGLGKGLSGDRLYKVVDPAGKPLLVIKAFLKSRGKFSREFSTLMNHERLQLHHLYVPTVFGVGALKREDKTVYFLVTDFIQGTSVYDMAMELMAQKLESRERKEGLKRLLHVYAKLGKGMAEFHGLARGEKALMHPAFRNLLNLFGTNALKTLKKVLDSSSFNRLQQFYTNGLEREGQKKLALGYLHGDLNLGNLIYRDQTDQLSAIDWPDGSISVGKEGQSFGISFYDIIQIRNELKIKKSQGLTEEEYTQLDQCFLTHYKENGGVLPSEETWNFFSVVDLIGSLKWFLDKKERFEEKDFARAEAIYRQKLTQLMSEIL